MFRRVRDNVVPVDREQRIAERKARLARGLEKRAPDNATVTVTDTNTVCVKYSRDLVCILMVFTVRLCHYHLYQHCSCLHSPPYQ